MEKTLSSPVAMNIFNTLLFFLAWLALFLSSPLAGQSPALDADELERLPLNYRNAEAALYSMPTDFNVSIGAGARSFSDWLQEAEGLSLTVETDLIHLNSTRFEQEYQPALIRVRNGRLLFREEAKVRTRGHFRCRHCDVPPIKLKVSKKKMRAAGFGEWNEFKIVLPCKKGKIYKEYILKEYLAYRLFNILTENSFRVRLLNLHLKDINRRNAYESPVAFLIEHAEEAEDRLGGKELKDESFNPGRFSRRDYTRLQVFQYMIGNTDWMPVTAQNLKVIQLDNGNVIPIPYDFDFSGLVNAEYAIPNPRTGLKDVRSRIFMGNGKTREEIEAVLDEFRAKEDEMISAVARFEALDFRERKRMIRYLQSFFSILSDPQQVEKEFVDNPPFEFPMY